MSWNRRYIERFCGNWAYKKEPGKRSAPFVLPIIILNCANEVPFSLFRKLDKVYNFLTPTGDNVCFSAVKLLCSIAL